MIDREELRQNFRDRYGREPRLFRAPGRVNLIGEHTDYNDGFVLPIALNYATYVAGSRRQDRIVRVHSLDVDEQFEFDLAHSDVPPPGGWLNYVEGTARSLAAQGNDLGGADLLLHSEVPIGGGLSSSAALEISVGFALLSLSGLPVDRMALARAGQQAEHDYVGAKVGLMDQLASVYGRKDTALLIDCGSLAIQPIPVHFDGLSIIVCDSRVKHNLAASAYNTRRAECEQAVEILRRRMPNIKALADVSVSEYERWKEDLPEPVGRRCRHVVSENARTLAAAHALGKGEIDSFGTLMFESHRSLRDDYEVSSRELDLLVETAARITGVIGSRLTGGGFGGCTVSLVADTRLEEFRQQIEDSYQSVFARSPAFYSVHAGNGAEELEENT